MYSLCNLKTCSAWLKSDMKHYRALMVGKAAVCNCTTILSGRLLVTGVGGSRLVHSGRSMNTGR